VNAETKSNETLELELFACWVNSWGDETDHKDAGKSVEWCRGYHEAMYEVWQRVKPLAPDWLDTWRAEWI
jgi:hypothetical protein